MTVTAYLKINQTLIYKSVLTLHTPQIVLAVPGQKSAQFMTTLSSVNALVDSEDLHFDVLVFGATNLARWRCHMPSSAVVPNDSHYLLFQRHAVECGCLYFWPQQLPDIRF